MPGPNELPPPPGAPMAGPAAANPAPAAGGPNIGAIIKRMLAHLPVAVVVMGLGLAITMVMARQRKPTYSSETVVQYRHGIARQFVGVEGGEDMKQVPGRLKGVLLSGARLEKIIKEFNLYPKIVAMEGYVAAVDKFRTAITFKPRSQEEFNIAYVGTTAEEAQQVTARLADILVEDVNENKKTIAKNTTEFLETEKKRADEELEKRETELAQFIARHPEFAAENNGEQAGAGVRAEKARAIADPELLALDRQQQRIRAAIAAKAAPGGPLIPGAPAGPNAAAQAILAAKQAADGELAAAQKDLNEKREKLTEAHPDVRQAQSRFVAAQAKQREATAAMIAAAPDPAPVPGIAPPAGDDPYETKGADAATLLERELAKNEREIQMRKRGIKPDTNASTAADKIIEIEKEWKSLNSARTTARSRQADIDLRLFKAKQNEESEMGGYNASIVVMEPAYLPVQPNTMAKQKFVTIGVLVSLLVGLVAAAAWGIFLDDRVFVADDLAQLAPALVTVPAAPPEKPAKGKRRG